LEYEDIHAGKARLIERGERFGEISLKVSFWDWWNSSRFGASFYGFQLSRNPLKRSVDTVWLVFLLSLWVSIAFRFNHG
jgi:hypothetical protein